MFICEDLGTVDTNAKESVVMIAYDDIESIQYFGDNLKGWWAKDGQVSFNEILVKASEDYNSVCKYL